MILSKEKQEDAGGFLLIHILVEWNSEGATPISGCVLLFSVPCSYYTEAGGAHLKVQVATGTPSVATQAFSLERRPGSPRGIIERSMWKLK